MTTKAQQDLLDAWTAFLGELSKLDAQDGLGPDRAKAMRIRMAGHLASLTDVLAGKTSKCLLHPTELAHNCGPCRGEAIGRAHDDPASKHLPDMSDDARAIKGRILGERERGHRI